MATLSAGRPLIRIAPTIIATLSSTMEVETHIKPLAIVSSILFLCTPILSCSKAYPVLLSTWINTSRDTTLNIRITPNRISAASIKAESYRGMDIISP